MRRQDKYPDTPAFHFHNANPKNRFTTDCVVRAISVACKVPYSQVVMDLAKIQCETGYDASENKGIDILMAKYGWVKHKQPRKFDNTKYTGKEFCHLLQSRHDGRDARILANIGGHHIVAIVDGRVWDTWDSTNGCIGNYWVMA